MPKLKLKFLSLFLATALFLNTTPLQTLAVKPKRSSNIANLNNMKTFKRKIIETNNSLNKNKDNQKKCEQLKKQLNNQIIDVTKKIDSIKDNMKSLQEQVNKQQEELKLHTKEVDQNIQKINEFNKKAEEISNKLNVTKNSALDAAKLNYLECKTNNNFISQLCESDGIGNLIKYSEYLEKTSEKTLKDMNDFSETSKQLAEAKQQIEETKKKNEELKKIAQNKTDELKQKQRDLILLNEKEKQGLSALNAGLLNAQEKTKEMQIAEKRLEEAKKRYEKADESLQAAIEEQKRRYPNGMPAAPNDKNGTEIVNRKRSASAPPVRNGKMCFPLPSGRISSGYGPRGKKFHHGMDICAPIGTAIYCAAPGVIEFMGSTGPGGGYFGYGKCMKIRHANGICTLYGHMDRFNNKLKVGDHVDGGMVIGYVGKTGDAPVSHLHWEVIVNGKKVNPKGYY